MGRVSEPGGISSSLEFLGLATRMVHQLKSLMGLTDASCAKFHSIEAFSTGK